MTKAARSLAFAPAMRTLADRVVAGITAAKGAGGDVTPVEFNAAHLRLEKDARDWAIILGGQAVRPNFHAPELRRMRSQLCAS